MNLMIRRSRTRAPAILLWSVGIRLVASVDPADAWAANGDHVNNFFTVRCLQPPPAAMKDQDRLMGLGRRAVGHVLSGKPIEQAGRVALDNLSLFRRATLVAEHLKSRKAVTRSIPRLGDSLRIFEYDREVSALFTGVILRSRSTIERSSLAAERSGGGHSTMFLPWLLERTRKNTDHGEANLRVHIYNIPDTRENELVDLDAYFRHFASK